MVRYTPYYSAWQDQPSTATPIIAAALNNMEKGIGQKFAGTLPEWYGTIGAGSDDVAINAAISAINAGSTQGPLWLWQPYSIAATITAQAGVNIFCTGQGNRQVGPPDTFTGGVIAPSSSFPASTPLVTVGTTGSSTTNPNGIILDGLNLSGYNGSAEVTGCIGVQINDTADVRLSRGFLANFDRTGATGTCVQLNGSASNAAVGLDIYETVLSSSWRGLDAEGTGATDMRMSGNLYHSNTQAITLGATSGGGGFQSTNNHYVYASAPAGAYALSHGSQAGDYMIENDYFDKYGNNPAVLLANAKGKFTGNHFLADSALATYLVKLSTANQEITFALNDCQGNGSGMTALLATTGNAGAPTGGVYFGNNVYGTAASLVAVLIDSASAAIANVDSATTYVHANNQFT